MAGSDPLVGTLILNRYRIVARLAAGGMGVVYLARAEGAAGFAKPVVVKRILPEHTTNTQMARLFVREAKILANLQHPNIVGVTDFGEEGGAYIMVLDYVRAYALGLWLHYRVTRNEKLPAAGAIHIITKVLDALEYAHSLTLPDGTRLEIIHSDISPSNILVDTDGQVKLLDFGIARMRGENTKSTEKGTIRGKLGYLPMEALDGSPPSVATDIYACGVTLYELLAGDHPFAVDDDMATIGRVMTLTPKPITSYRPEVSPELDGILAKAMSRDPRQRYASAKEFARELRRIQPLPEQEAAGALGTLARSDFTAMPQMAELGAIPLSDLEDAWRNAPSSQRAIVLPSTGQLELAATSPGSLAPRGPGPKKMSVGTLAAIFGVLLVVGGGLAAIVVLFMKRAPDTDEPKIILVEHGGAASASAGPAVTTSVIPTSSADTPAPSASVSAQKPAQKPADPLTAAFAKNQPQFSACVSSNSGPDMPDVQAMRLTIGKDGTVQQAELVPAESGATPLGQCLLGVAKKTQFPPQNATETIRIPFHAKRAP